MYLKEDVQSINFLRFVLLFFTGSILYTYNMIKKNSLSDERNMEKYCGYTSYVVFIFFIIIRHTPGWFNLLNC